MIESEGKSFFGVGKYNGFGLINTEDDDGQHFIAMRNLLSDQSSPPYLLQTLIKLE